MCKRRDGVLIMKRFFLSLIALVFLSCSADAASRFAICSTTCTWDGADTSMWSATSGGATGASVPGSGDTVTLDANTCVGGTTCTVTVNTNVNITSLTFGACTASTSGCILDFATNDNSVTISTTFSGTGTGTRTLNMGDGVWTFGGGTSATWNFVTTTNLTLNKNGSSIVWVGGESTSSFFGGALTWGALTINANATNPGSIYSIEPGNNANNTFASLTVNAPAWVRFRAGSTQTFTGGMTVSGSSASARVVFDTDNLSAGSSATIAVGAVSNVSWTLWRQTTGATSAINATNSLNLGNPSLGTLSITAPSSGGGRIIGG